MGKKYIKIEEMEEVILTDPAFIPFLKYIAQTMVNVAKREAMKGEKKC